MHGVSSARRANSKAATIWHALAWPMPGTRINSSTDARLTSPKFRNWFISLCAISRTGIPLVPRLMMTERSSTSERFPGPILMSRSLGRSCSGVSLIVGTLGSLPARDSYFRSSASPHRPLRFSLLPSAFVRTLSSLVPQSLAPSTSL